MPLQFNSNLNHITSQVFVNAPFDYLQQQIDTIIELGIQPEIGLEGNVLHNCSKDDFSYIAEKLHAANRPCTLHAPFHELSIGALDPFIRKVSLEKIRKAFELIPIFKPQSIVCHLGFEANKHGYKKEKWFNNSLKGWIELLDMAQQNNVPLMLENTYEFGPTEHREMLTALDSEYAKFCFDVGHTLAFAKNKWQDWLPELEPWLGQLHLHDNLADIDTHLPIGKGMFDFGGFFSYIKEKNLSPLITLEPHDEEEVEESLLAFWQTYK